MRLYLAGIMLLLFNGCASLSTQLHPDCDNYYVQDIPQIYSGTNVDFHCMIDCRLVANSYAMLDLPLSLVMDTVLLPVSIYKQVSQGNICPP